MRILFAREGQEAVRKRAAGDSAGPRRLLCCRTSGHLRSDRGHGGAHAAVSLRLELAHRVAYAEPGFTAAGHRQAWREEVGPALKASGAAAGKPLRVLGTLAGSTRFGQTPSCPVGRLIARRRVLRALHARRALEC
jgi:hypothetical protein